MSCGLFVLVLALVLVSVLVLVLVSNWLLVFIAYLQHYNITTLQHYNITTLQHYNITTLENTQISLLTKCKIGCRASTIRKMHFHNAKTPFKYAPNCCKTAQFAGLKVGTLSAMYILTLLKPRVT